MNLVQFLKTVDEYTLNADKSTLEGVIHELARTLPEAESDSFLGKLCTGS